MGRSAASRSIRLSSGLTAEIVEDPLQAAALVLLVGNAEQSHLYPGEPARIFYEYLQRVACLIDAVFPAAQPLDMLHLGAGALTLPRYVAATRPASRQVVVEIERELIDFVRSVAPLPPESVIDCVTADARGYVEDLEPGVCFDVVFLDIFSGPDSPAHLADPGFYDLLARRCRPGGMVVVNLGDDAGMAFARDQIRHLQLAFADVLATGEERLFSGRFPGNIIAAGGTAAFSDATAVAVTSAGPHPARTLRGADLDGFGEP